MTQPSAPLFVFISYSRADSQMVARLWADLQARGIQAWIDEEGIQPGTPDWEEAVRQALRTAQVVLFLASPQARSSRYVKDELRIAEMYRRPICPVWIAGSEWMEAIPLGWGETQYIDARGPSYETALPTIVKIVAAQRPMPVPPPVAPPGEPRNPYKGLRAFTGEDRQDFFGRDTLIDELTRALAGCLTAEQEHQCHARLLTVIGPSGSGKSSVVMAGLLPCLQAGKLDGSRDWVYLPPIVPGAHPLESLTLALAEHLPTHSLKMIREDLQDDTGRGLHLLATMLARRPGTRVVLFVDQFEELFTQTTTEAERQCFLDVLVTALTEPSGPLIVILALRADFGDRPMHYPDLGKLLEDHRCPVLPMALEDLRAVIEKPAAFPDVQLTFEGDLVGDLLFEMRGQAGALPLLQFTLDQLVEQRDGHQLTLQAYHELGGVQGALSRHAEETYQALPSDTHRQMARDVFVRLIEPGTSEQDTTRRRAALSEFKQADPVQSQQMHETLEAFTRARLLTTNQSGGHATIEVSHEAVLREWKRLAEWLRGACEDIRFQHSLSKDVSEWEQRKQPKARLYRGAQLKEAQAWVRRNRPSERELTFLRASATRRIQSLVSLIAVVLLLISSTGIAGWKVFFQPNPTLVTTLQDNGEGSLRWCVNNAPSGSTITFAQDLRGILILTAGDLLFARGKSLTITGPGASHLTISGGNLHAQIHVPQSSKVTLSGLSFTKSETVYRGFLYNEGTLTITNSIISANKTTADGDNISSGGGINNATTGTLTVRNSLISNNIASSNSGQSQGGGIRNAGRLTVITSIIRDNTAVSSSGTSFSGGIDNYQTGTLTVTNSTLSNNSASGGQNGQGGGIDNSGKLAVTNSTFSNNSANGKQNSFGGGINNYQTGTLTVTNNTFSNNSASGTQSGQGGGINNSGKLTMSNSTFSNNAASSKQDSYGGGISISQRGTAMVSNSTFSNNAASGKQDVYGGGIDNSGKLTVTNSTFWHNTASGGSAMGGGGIAFDGINKDSSTILRFCTLYGNISRAGGGMWVDPTGSNQMTIGSTIIAANSAHDGSDISGALSSAGYNLSDNFAGATGLNPTTDKQVALADLKIDPTLRNNGGPTQTLALLPGSPAIDAVPGQACSITVPDVSGQMMTITTDQRGVPRLHRVKNACDSGAYGSSSQG